LAAEIIILVVPNLRFLSLNTVNIWLILMIIIWLMMANNQVVIVPNHWKIRILLGESQHFRGFNLDFCCLSPSFNQLQPPFFGQVTGIYQAYRISQSHAPAMDLLDRHESTGEAVSNNWRFYMPSGNLTFCY